MIPELPYSPRPVCRPVLVAVLPPRLPPDSTASLRGLMCGNRLMNRLLSGGGPSGPVTMVPAPTPPPTDRSLGQPGAGYGYDARATAAVAAATIAAAVATSAAIAASARVGRATPRVAPGPGAAASLAGRWPPGRPAIPVQGGYPVTVPRPAAMPGRPAPQPAQVQAGRPAEPAAPMAQVLAGPAVPEAVTRRDGPAPSPPTPTRRVLRGRPPCTPKARPRPAPTCAPRDRDLAAIREESDEGRARARLARPARASCDPPLLSEVLVFVGFRRHPGAVSRFWSESFREAQRRMAPRLAARSRAVVIMEPARSGRPRVVARGDRADVLVIGPPLRASREPGAREFAVRIVTSGRARDPVVQLGLTDVRPAELYHTSPCPDDVLAFPGASWLIFEVDGLPASLFRRSADAAEGRPEHLGPGGTTAWPRAKSGDAVGIRITAAGELAALRNGAVLAHWPADRARLPTRRPLWGIVRLLHRSDIGDQFVELAEA